MGKKKHDSLSRCTERRKYRPVCWISAEGATEKDYFRMNVFRDIDVSIRFPRDIHSSRRNPSAVLKRMKKALQEEDFRKTDEAWIVVDADVSSQEEIEELLAWAKEDDRNHIAISNPKFELFLVMHFEKGNGCTTSCRVDETLKRHIPSYDKRLGLGQFTEGQVRDAILRAKAKRASCSSEMPDTGMTDVHLLAESLLDKKNNNRGQNYTNH